MNQEFAFPCPAGTGEENGMTLRDYFAAQAIKPIMMLGEARKNTADCAYYANHAYMMADAMLGARKK